MNWLKISVAISLILISILAIKKAIDEISWLLPFVSYSILALIVMGLAYCFTYVAQRFLLLQELHRRNKLVSVIMKAGGEASYRETFLFWNGRTDTADLGHAPIPHTIHNAIRDTPYIEVKQAEPKFIAQPVSSSSLIRQLPFNGLQTVLGVNHKTGLIETTNIQQDSHKLITGSSGTGKSTLCQLDIASGLISNSYETLKYICLDYEGLTSSLFKSYVTLETESDDIMKQLDNIVSILRTRQTELKKYLETSDVSLDNPFIWPDRLVIFIEEFLAFQNMLDRPVKQKYIQQVKDLALTGRKFGILLMLSTQCQYADDTSLSALRGQCRTRVTGSAERQQLTSSLGYQNSPELKDLVLQNKPGYFLRQKQGVATLIDVPQLDLETLPGLLKHRLKRSINTVETIKVSQAEIAVIDAFKAGKSYGQIQADLGISKSTAHGIISKFNIVRA